MRPQLKLSLLSALASSLLAAACSSGGGMGGSQGSSPTVSSIATQSVNQDTPVGPIRFSVSSSTGTADQLAVTASSSNPDLLPDSGITVAGSGTSRTITLTPLADAFGTAEITITARDAQGRSARATFPVIVSPVFASFTSTANAAFAADEDARPLALSGVTLQPDADEDDNAFATALQ